MPHQINKMFMYKKWFVVMSFCFAIVFLLLILSPNAQHQLQKPPVIVPLIDKFMLSNMDYHIDSNKFPIGIDSDFTLNNGTFRKNGSNTSIVQIDIQEPIAIGDLNEDGQEDAVVVLASWHGGSSNFIHLAAVINQQGQLQNVNTTFLGERVIVKQVNVQNGIIEVNMLDHKVGDPICCPTWSITRRYKLIDNKLMEFSKSN